MLSKQEKDDFRIPVPVLRNNRMVDKNYAHKQCGCLRVIDSVHLSGTSVARLKTICFVTVLTQSQSDKTREVSLTTFVETSVL
jgi:hypothetical protein